MLISTYNAEDNHPGEGFMWPKRSIVLRMTNPVLYPEESLRIQTACPFASYVWNAAFLGTGSMEAKS